MGGVLYGEKVLFKIYLIVLVFCYKWKNINILGVEYYEYRCVMLLLD